VHFDGAWNTDRGPQFQATIPLPDACYATTYAQEAALQGVTLRRLSARADAEVDMTRALGVTDNPPVERVDWTIEVDSDADAATLDAIKQTADEHCPGVYCLRNPIELRTELVVG